MGETLAFNQSEGRKPSIRDFEKMTCKMGATSRQSFRRNRGLMWSGPGALSGFRPCSNFMMPFTEMSMSVMLVYLFLASGGTFSGM